MNHLFSTFKKFPDLQQAKELEQLLALNNIESRLIENKSNLDGSFASVLLNEYEIKIRPEDFDRADSLVEGLVAETLNEIDKDYYLLSFSDEELYDIIRKKDEWNEFDYLLARKLLTERGKKVDDELINNFKKQRLKELAKPEPHRHGWVISGYIFAFLGGFLGIVIGYLLWTSQKSLPNGTKVYSYSEYERMHGKTIFIIGLIIFPVALLMRILDKIA